MRFLGPEVSPDDPVAAAFSSQENIHILNTLMHDGVLEASSGRFNIGQQSQQELKTIMRSVYLNEARNLPFDIAGQVRALNSSVLAYAVPQIVSEAESHVYFIEDRKQEKRPAAPQPIMTSTAGARSEVAAPMRAFYEPAQL